MWYRWYVLVIINIFFEIFLEVLLLCRLFKRFFGMVFVYIFICWVRGKIYIILVNVLLKRWSDWVSWLEIEMFFWRKRALKEFFYLFYKNILNDIIFNLLIFVFFLLKFFWKMGRRKGDSRCYGFRTDLENKWGKL